MLRPCYGTYRRLAYRVNWLVIGLPDPLGRQDNLLTIVRKLRLDDTCFQFVRFRALDDSEVNMKPGGGLRGTYMAPPKNR
jgi:hypothetical protein